MLWIASTAQECKLCRLLFNAANSIQSAVSQASVNSPPRPPATGINHGDSSRTRSGAILMLLRYCLEILWCKTYQIVPLYLTPLSKIRYYHNKD